MASRSRLSARRRLRAIAAPLAAGLVATMVSACALKAPPDAAAVKEQALPTLQTPAQWTATGVGASTAADNWVAAFQDDQLAAAVAEAIAHNADLRVGAARVEQAQLHAKLAGAKLYPSVDLLAHGGGKLSGTARASRVASSPRTGSSTSGAACATAGRRAQRKPRRRRRISSTRASR